MFRNQKWLYSTRGMINAKLNFGLRGRRYKLWIKLIMLDIFFKEFTYKGNVKPGKSSNV
jgi:hypothetical protein